MCRFTYFKAKCDLEHCPLSTSNYSQVHDILIRHVQGQSFDREIWDLKTDRPLLRSSVILCLNPFGDQEGILRIGGITSYHTILVSHTHPVASVIVSYYHSQAYTRCEWVLSLVGERYWITKARRITCKVIYNWVACRKMFAKPST